MVTTIEKPAQSQALAKSRGSIVMAISRQFADYLVENGKGHLYTELREQYEEYKKAAPDSIYKNRLADKLVALIAKHERSMAKIRAELATR